MGVESQAAPGQPFPQLTFKMLDGTTFETAEFAGGWSLLIVYRGHHCPRCKDYIASLHKHAPAYSERRVRIVLGSADPAETARQTVAEEGWTLPVFAGLTVDQMSALGLFITDPGDDSTIHGLYSEPGLFLINPDGLLQTLSTSNSPSTRPDLEVFLDGVIGTQDRNLPIRGMYRP